MLVHNASPAAWVGHLRKFAPKPDSVLPDGRCLSPALVVEPVSELAYVAGPGAPGGASGARAGAGIHTGQCGFSRGFIRMDQIPAVFVAISAL